METTFRETSADPRVEAVPLSHLSLELGHLYMEDFAAGPDRLRDHFRRVAPWAQAASRTGLPDRARVSTCFLIDDYFTRLASPAEILPVVVDAATECGLRIDYLVRESACAETDGVSLAALVAGRLTAVPPPGSNGSRPPALEVGWLSNGQRSPADSGEAMRRARWEPPAEINARNHSVFVDVELWSERNGERKWSCAYLSAVWQLLRLGLLRDNGATVLRPEVSSRGFPGDWDELPAVVQLQPKARPLCAYRTFSVLPARFLQVENAVRIILGQVSPQPEAMRQIIARSELEEFPVPGEVVSRVGYAFFGD